MIVNGQEYIVLSKVKIKGYDDREEVCVKKPRGKRKYHFVIYEDGSISSVV